MQSPEGLDYTPFKMANSKTEFFKMANPKKKIVKILWIGSWVGEIY